MASEEAPNLGEYDTIAFKTATSTATSLLLGGVTGAVVATWRDVPAVERNAAVPALVKTARMMRFYGLYFAAVGGTFAFVDAVAQHARGKRDIWNGVLGGFAAGAVVGLHASSLPVAVGAAAALGATSAIADTSGHVTKIDTGREFLPYSPPAKS